MSTTKTFNIDAISAGPELDALVAFRIMDWGMSSIQIGGNPVRIDYTPPEGDRPESVPEFSTDANHIREVEAEIERRGLSERYAWHLVCVIEGIDFTYEPYVATGNIFPLITATSEQRCRAAYKAVMG